MKEENKQVSDEKEAEIERTWEEFKRRLNEDRMIEFSPSCVDLDICNSRRRFGRSIGLFVEAVLMPLPLDFFKEMVKLCKIVFSGTLAFAIAIISIPLLPVMFLIRRLTLMVAMFLGTIVVNPKAESIVVAMNKRMMKVRNEMEDDGYDVTEFWDEVEPEEITDEAKAHILRNWKGK